LNFIFVVGVKNQQKLLVLPRMCKSGNRLIYLLVFSSCGLLGYETVIWQAYMNTADITFLFWLKVKVSVHHSVIQKIVISGNPSLPETLDKTVFTVQTTLSFQPQCAFNFMHNFTGVKDVSYRGEHLCALF
jgi:hypothetical protein